MTGLAFTESVVESAALAWLESLGWTVKHGPEIVPGELAAERADYGQVVLAQWLCDALGAAEPAASRPGVRRHIQAYPSRGADAGGVQSRCA